MSLRRCAKQCHCGSHDRSLAYPCTKYANHTLQKVLNPQAPPADYLSDRHLAEFHLTNTTKYIGVSRDLGTLLSLQRLLSKLAYSERLIAKHHLAKASLEAKGQGAKVTQERRYGSTIRMDVGEREINGGFRACDRIVGNRTSTRTSWRGDTGGRGC